MRIIGHMVTHNEANRYLKTCLAWLNEFADVIVVYDDRSVDSTVKICEDAGARVRVRPSNFPAFLTHEGQFRAAAWQAIKVVRPTRDDWILCIDADEFLVSTNEERPRHHLERLADTADNMDGYRLNFHEVFAVDQDGVPQIRKDGYWSNVTGVRFCRWIDGPFPDRRCGCGSVPAAVQHVCDAVGIDILHYGYANLEDRHNKYRRYTEHPGHNPVHVRSIMAQSRLVPFEFDHPDV